MTSTIERHGLAPADLVTAYTGKRVAVAGVSGFIGINTAIALRQAGAHVVGIARRRTGLATAVCNEVVVADLEARGSADVALEGTSIVFDCLGYPALAPSDLDPGNNLEAEFRPHLNLFLDCARQPGSPVVVNVSTRLVYGTPLMLPIGEGHPLNPGSLYSAHKLLVEHYIGVLAKTHGLRATVFRLSSPYGPNGPGTPGRLGVWNQFIQKALRGEALTIYGEGDQLRDFVHIDDITRAFLAAAVTPGCVGEVFNFGGELAMPLREAVMIIAEEAGGVPVEFIPWPAAARKVETGDYRTDLDKIRRFVDLPPQITFREGVRRTIAAIRGDAICGPRVVPLTPRPAQAAPTRLPLTDFRGKRVLVAGASGFLGGHLVRRFYNEGATVFALSRTAGTVDRIAGGAACSFEPCDLTCAEATEAAVVRAAPDIVLYIAACPDGAETAALIRARFDVNVLGLLNLLEACRLHAPQAHIVYGDSRKVYGDATAPHRAATPTAPASSYAVAKEAAWHLCKLYTRLYGMTIVSVRPSLIYGPGQGVNVIRAVADAAGRGDDAIRLAGGDQTRDPLFIDDAVDAFVTLAGRAEELSGRTLLIGGSEEIAVRDLAQLVLDVCGSGARVVADPRAMRATDMRRSACDLSEAADLLDWTPHVGLREGLELTLQDASLQQLMA